jgi:serine/threonine protein kinase
MGVGSGLPAGTSQKQTKEWNDQAGIWLLARSVSSMTTITKAGRYEIVGELGRGAMGVVYKATDPVIGRAVAVKTIRLSEEGTGLTRPELLTRFQTEARAAGLLTHPNIVVVYDAGEEDGLYYITMELVEGKSLQAHLDGGHAFPLPRVMRIMEQICSALQFAHERNVVHRDVKPANIMLTGDDTVKVTDFGTAKILQFGTVQQTAHVMGTPSYMSPEQVKGRAVDGRSDIFALGVMLYEMLTGEKPFPGQNITTVIYKIVNEDPVPPRQIDSTIHPGISATVMRALAKEPESRYQSCREMLEDLRNYRNIGAANGSPQATIVMGAQPSPAATIAMNGGGLRGMRPDDAMAAITAQSLISGGTNPVQTPTVRRTGSLLPYQEYQEPKKKNIVGTILAALVLVSVIAYGAYKLRPVYYEARQSHEVASTSPVSTPSTSDTPAANGEATTSAEPKARENGPVEQPSAAPSSAMQAAATPSGDIEPKVQPAPTQVSAVEGIPAASVEKAPPKKIEPAISPKAAEFKRRVDEAISEKGLSGRAKVQAVGNTLVLGGKLRPAEHGGLLKLLRDAPGELRVVDHIEYDDTAAPAEQNSGEGGHPVPSTGRGAIHVVTDVIGASAVLHGPAGRVLNQCQTPCSFNNLFPARYSLEVTKDGYQPVQTALQVRANDVSDQKLSLESLAKGLLVNSEPPGADVFINGAKQAGQTPVALPLAPGQYNLVLRLEGYGPYAGTVQVKDNIQTQLAVKLTERASSTHVAFAQVETNPPGAEILVDGNSTGKSTPSRVQVPAGIHTVILRLDGFQAVRRTVQVSEGGTVIVAEALKKQ